MIFCAPGWKGPSCLHVEPKAPYGKIFPNGLKNILTTPLWMGARIRANNRMKANPAKILKSYVYCSSAPCAVRIF